MTDAQPAIRVANDVGRDDHTLPFAVEPLDVRGRVVRLGATIDHILKQHAYPDPVSRTLGEAITLTALLGSALKLEGRFQLQAKTDGIIDMMVVDFDAPGSLRAMARFDRARLSEAGIEKYSSAKLIGSGHLALTIDQGGDMSRYQGVVALDGHGLEEAAHQYFRQSEQIPTFVRLAVAESVTASAGAHWRAGGLMIQFLPVSPERQRQQEFHPGDAPEGTTQAEFVEDDAWAEAKALAATVEDHELVDPTLSSERLLYRLFHERGVKVFESHELHDQCRCSAERIEQMLRRFTPNERRDMTGDDGMISVTCEFCSVRREFNPADFEGQETDE